MSSPLLKILADNKELSLAVRDVLEKCFSTDNLTSDLADIELGQMVRARLVGLKAINEAFAEIARHGSVREVEEKHNPAY